MSYLFIEGCCGTAALSYYLSGFEKPILSYQGSKWRYRREIKKILTANGYSGKPHSIELYDSGPWSRIIPIVNEKLNDVIKEVQILNELDPYQVYSNLQNNPPSDNDIIFAAEFLFLQRLSFSGKAVGCRSGKWNSPGFNKTCAYGVKGTDKFGEIKPMIPSLIKTLNGFGNHSLPITASGEYLNKFPFKVKDTVLYLDPPYRNSTKYPDGDLSREELVKLALSWREAGAFVLISEAEPIKELSGWNRECISLSKNNASNFKTKKEEWITFS